MYNNIILFHLIYPSKGQFRIVRLSFVGAVKAFLSWQPLTFVSTSCVLVRVLLLSIENFTVTKTTQARYVKILTFIIQLPFVEHK